VLNGRAGEGRVGWRVWKCVGVGREAVFEDCENVTGKDGHCAGEVLPGGAGREALVVEH